MEMLFSEEEEVGLREKCQPASAAAPVMIAKRVCERSKQTVSWREGRNMYVEFWIPLSGLFEYATAFFCGCRSFWSGGCGIGASALAGGCARGAEGFGARSPGYGGHLGCCL